MVMALAARRRPLRACLARLAGLVAPVGAGPVADAPASLMRTETAAS